MQADGAGWHQRGRALQVPNNIVLLSLPPYSPELNAMGERLELELIGLRQRIRSQGMTPDQDGDTQRSGPNKTSRAPAPFWSATVTGGGNASGACASGIFFQCETSNGILTVSPAAGQTLTISNSIMDEVGAATVWPALSASDLSQHGRMRRRPRRR